MENSENLINFMTADNGFTRAEKWVVKMQYREFFKPGNFECKLWETICAADLSNRALLGMGFPDLVNAVNAWQYRDLGDRLRKAGLRI